MGCGNVDDEGRLMTGRNGMGGPIDTSEKFVSSFSGKGPSYRYL